MFKKDLVKAITTDTGLTKREAGLVIDAIISTIIRSIKNEEKVSIVGFGSFELMHRAPRNCRNPKTGEPITIPARKQPRFAAGKNLKEAVN